MMEDPNELVDNLDLRLREYPFVRPGMTLREYDEEKKYYLSVGIEALKNQTYVPLWKQRENANKK